MASPSFKKKHGEEHAPRNLYELLGDLAHHLVESVRENQLDELPKVFNLIERLLTDGDEEIKEATTIGLLEGIQNIYSHEETGIGQDVFLPYLRENTKLWWQALNDFWSGKKSTVRLR